MAMSLPSRPRALRLALLALVVGASLLVASTWRYFGQTWDEPEHLAAGLSLLEHDHYVYDIQHPPLARALIAIGPYLAGARSLDLPPPDGEPEGREILYREGHYDLFLRLARLGALPFLAVLLAATWAWTRASLPPESARRDLSALLAVALVAATPPLLGHAGLACLDVAAAGTCLFALWGLLRWVERPHLRTAAVFGVTLALATATKLSALPFIGLATLALFALRPWMRGDSPPALAGDSSPPRRLGTWVGEFALIGGILTVVLTLAYGGRFVYLTDPHFGYAHSIDFVFGTKGLMHDAVRAIANYVPVPEAVPLLLGGIEALEVHNAMGHLSYLLGEVRTTGWWYFYLVALAAKLPIPLLVLGVVGLGGLAREGVQRRSLRLVATPTVFVVVLAFCSGFSHINIGVRHVLVLIPLLAVGAAWSVFKLWEWSAALIPSGRLALRTATLLLLVWQASTLPRAYPDYLAYFNEAVPHPEEVLVDSDLDWGQDLRRLERRAHELSLPRLGLAYLGSADPSREPLPPVVLLKPGQRATGWVAINELARIHGGRGYSWLNAYAPRERIGKTIDLYYIGPITASRSSSPRSTHH
jgi:4-amino-4-deoxy-L-arabinose transferase-like glycosyltransferase